MEYAFEARLYSAYLIDPKNELSKVVKLRNFVLMLDGYADSKGHLI